MFLFIFFTYSYFLHNIFNVSYQSLFIFFREIISRNRWEYYSGEENISCHILNQSCLSLNKLEKMLFRQHTMLKLMPTWGLVLSPCKLLDWYMKNLGSCLFIFFANIMNGRTKGEREVICSPKVVVVIQNF